MLWVGNVVVSVVKAAIGISGVVSTVVRAAVVAFCVVREAMAGGIELVEHVLEHLFYHFLFLPFFVLPHIVSFFFVGNLPCLVLCFNIVLSLFFFSPIGCK